MSQHDETRNDPTSSDDIKSDPTLTDPTQNETTEITVEPSELEPTEIKAEAQRDETTTIETLLDESDSTRSSTSHPSASPDPAPVPASEPVSDRDFRPVDPSPAQPYASQYASTHAQPTQTAVPEFKSGPAPTTSVFGLLGLLTAIAVLVSQATDLDIAWGVVGPVAVVGAGVLLVVLGLAGLRGQRFRG